MDVVGLRKLADFLDNDPRVAKHFDMESWIEFDTFAVEPHDYVEERNRAAEDLLLGTASCGTAACAAGWAWVAADELGFEKASHPDSQGDLLLDDDHTNEWDFAFGERWNDNPHDAARRLRYLADHGQAPDLDEWPKFGLTHPIDML